MQLRLLPFLLVHCLGLVTAFDGRVLALAARRGQRGVFITSGLLGGGKERPKLPAGADTAKPSREELLDTLWGNEDFQQPSEQRRRRGPEPDTAIPSHLTLERDEEGEPLLARMTYVDESTCIGCKNCAFVARNTFFMEESFAGKARVYNQGGDSDELIDEAIDSCPVNCIHYVSTEDLATLENERVARDDNLDFNNYANFKRAWTGQDAPVSETKAQFYGSLASGARCNNCPSRGCAECPMFGVGENPLYLKRKRARELRKERDGTAERERREREAQRRIDILYGSAGSSEAAGGAAGGVSPDGERLDSVFDAIFGEYSFEADAAAGTSEQQLSYGAAEDEAKARLREELEDDAAITDTLDPYAVLGVRRDASIKEIKRAFRRLAMRWHPDRNARLPEVERLQAELIFKQVNLAHEVLTDAAKRKLYDEGQSDSLRDVLGGFWERLSQRMQGSRSRPSRTAVAGKGVVKPVAMGSGVALAELAAEEERDSGIQAPLLLGAVAPKGGDRGGEDEHGEAADGSNAEELGEREPGVKYDYWGRPMA
jgi:ferredoxin